MSRHLAKLSRARITGWVIGITAVFLSPSLAWTSQFEVLPLDRLVSLSSHIVEATCMDVQSRWSDDKTLIVSRARFRVRAMLKGRSESETITVLVPGGTVGDTTMLVVGAPDLQQGEENVLMLDRLRPGLGNAGEYNLVGLSQGKFDLRVDSGTNTMRARSSALGLFEASEAPPGGSRGWTLEQLRGRIGALVREQARP